MIAIAASTDRHANASLRQLMRPPRARTSSQNRAMLQRFRNSSVPSFFGSASGAPHQATQRSAQRYGSAVTLGDVPELDQIDLREHVVEQFCDRELPSW